MRCGVFGLGSRENISHQRETCAEETLRNKVKVKIAHL